MRPNEFEFAVLGVDAKLKEKTTNSVTELFSLKVTSASGSLPPPSPLVVKVSYELVYS